MKKYKIEEEIERVCNEMRERYHREGALKTWQEKTVFGSHKHSGIKKIIEKLLLDGYKVKGGYICTITRDDHMHSIFFKKTTTM